MLENPEKEWRRLTEHYSSLSDEELCDLAADFADLTEMAQMVLRDEFKKRKLGDPEAILKTAEPPAGQVPPQYDATDDCADVEADGDGTTEAAEDSGPVEYTWKMPLCECETQEQARQLSEVLNRAGIENWIEAHELSRFHQDMALPYSRIVVPADRLEDARQVAARPIPQEIVDDLKSLDEAPEEFAMPVCPACKAEEPVLQGVEPSNRWRCAVCGKTWTDPVQSTA